MEALVVVDHHHHHHKNQYYGGSGRNRAHGPARFGSPPSGNFRGINCRAFQSRSPSGLLPIPLKSCSTTPVTKRAFSPKTPSQNVINSPASLDQKKSRKAATKNSTAIPIPISCMKAEVGEGSPLGDGFHFSELWAGPAYSNSPPPSSLPIPKFFSVKPKRTVSLELTSSASEVDLRQIAKSAPASPTRERSPSPPGEMFDFDDSADCATKTLRRILNLDITDE